MAMNRREFLETSAAAGLLAMLPSQGRAAEGPAPRRSSSDDLNVAIIGIGEQGRTLLESCVLIPGLHFKAVCDIWPYQRQRAQGLLRQYKHEVNAYADYGDMLDKEKDLDAVIVATPDFMHAEHSIACMKGGAHVYCEKMMSNSVEKARSMVRAMRETGKLLQIGHQRRSNPRYIFALRRVIQKARMLGRITHANGQWNRAVSRDIVAGPKLRLPDDVLKKYGYASMHEFLNWRMYKAYGGGPISDLGAHQLDVFNWFLDARPKSVVADGGVDYYKNREWYDNVMAIHEFDTPDGAVRTFYQVLTTTSAGGGYYEQFMGTEGALKISENPRFTKVFHEPSAVQSPWDEWNAAGYIATPEQVAEASRTVVDSRESPDPDAYELPVLLDKKIHQPHLENFFDAVRGKTALNCPADHAFESEMTVFKINEAVAAGRKLLFTAQDFEV
jgi:predicted dehydrogenase